MVAEVTRRFLLTLWNVYSFFVTYANIDRFTPGAGGAPPAPPELDRWLISELNQLILDVDAALDGYNPTEAGRRIEVFVDGLSNWYVRRSRRRFWKSENDADKQSAYDTLYYCLVTLAKLLAPLAPFLAEELYQNLVVSASRKAPDSVHLTDFPVADENRIDKQLGADIRLAIKLSSLGRAARSQAGIKVRQPLAANFVGLNSAQEREVLARIRPQLMEELNVKEIVVDSFENVAALDESQFAIVSEVGINSAISTHLTEDLKREGLAREIVHRLQTMRRQAGFDIADHIITYYKGDDYIEAIMQDEDLGGYIRQETLSRELVWGVPQAGVFNESFRLGGRDIVLGVKKLG